MSPQEKKCYWDVKTIVALIGFLLSVTNAIFGICAYFIPTFTYSEIIVYFVQIAIITSSLTAILIIIGVEKIIAKKLPSIDFTPYVQKLATLDSKTLLSDYRAIKQYYVPLDEAPIDFLSKKQAHEQEKDLVAVHSFVRKRGLRQAAQYLSKKIELSFWQKLQNFVRRLVGKTPLAYSLEDYLFQWAKDNGTKHNLLIAASRGKGKTILLQRVAHRLGKQWLRWKGRPVPLYFRFRDWLQFEKNDIVKTIRETFEQNLARLSNNYNWIEFQTMVKEGKVILLLDGFDELTRLTTTKDFEQVIGELCLTFSSTKAKIVISLRPEIFQTREELAEAFPVVKSPNKLPDEKACFHPLSIAFFDEAKISTYLTKRFKEQGELYAAILNQVVNSRLCTLPERPQLLNMIAIRIAEKIKEGKGEEELRAFLTNLTEYKLYREHIIKDWLKEDKLSRARTISLEPLEKILTKMAWQALKQNLTVNLKVASSQSDTQESLLSYAQRIVDFPLSPNILAHDLRLCTFLEYNDEQETFQFNHKSFAEFYVAEGFNRAKGETEAEYPLKQLYELSETNFDGVLSFLTNNSIRAFLQTTPPSIVEE